MYYALELFDSGEMIVRDVKDIIVHEVIENIVYYTYIKAFYGKDSIIIIDGKLKTLYYKCEKKRKQMIVDILNSRMKKSLDYLKSGQ